MNITQLLAAFLLGVHVEVIVAPLPKGSLSTLHGNGKFQSLERAGKRSVERLGDEKVDVFRHDHIADYEEAVAEADGFE